MQAWHLALLLCMCLACPGKQPAHKPPGDSAAAGKLTLFVTGELRGEIEPCGCTSDPLGDLARFAALLADARKTGPVVWLDAGSLLYSETRLSPGKAPQERLKAELIRAQAERLGLAAVGLGAFDLADGTEQSAPARLAANVEGGKLALQPSTIIEAGGAQVGVFGLVDERVATALGGKLVDPRTAAQAQVKLLRDKGADVVVALAQLDRREARKLVKDVPGLDFVVAGRDTPDYEAKAVPPGIDKNGDGYVLQPLQRGQSMIRVELDLAGSGPLVDAMGETRAKDRIAELDALLPDRQAKQAELARAAGADPGFVAQGQAEIDRLVAERAELEKNPLRKPASGSWFTAAHVLIKKKLRCEPSVIQAKKQFDMAAAAKNLEAAKSEPAIPVPAGQATYVGDEECSFCHKPANEFWQKTNHAAAWKTLTDLGKAGNRDCVSCHVTGWMVPGGATLAANENLRNVQCETCHGPGSKHVEADGKALASLVKAPPAERCLTCHTQAHSDTFEFNAYLRDVTGPGHGEKFRKALGDGPTGRALRSAALARAGAEIGDGCTK